VNKPIVLAILDGWGYRAETHDNAIALARKPTYDKLLATDDEEQTYSTIAVPNQVNRKW